MTKYIFSIIISTVILGCKKDKLKDEKAVLIGNWQWEKTFYESYNCQNCCPINFTLTPLSENKNYSMEFFKKGKVKFYEDNILSNENRIVFKNFYELGGGSVFSIHLDNDPTMKLVGMVYAGGDSLLTFDYPFKAYNDPCDEEYISYFYKVE